MDGANQRFMKNKDAWLARHLIIYNVRGGQTAADVLAASANAGTIGTELPVMSFDLRKIGDIINGALNAKSYELTGLDENKQVSGGKADLRKIGSRTNDLRAYFLPWGIGRCYSGRLGINADYFFTPTLNGCTFAYDGAGPNPSVAHSNIPTAGTQSVDQNATDASITAAFGGAPGFIIRRSDYKQPIPPGSAIADWRMMIVGIRFGNSWRFYRQNYTLETPATGGVVTVGQGLCTQM